MFKNYFKVALRNFWRNKIFSVINVFGLAIGISAAMVIFLIVHYEFSFDTFEKDRGKIYRVVTEKKFAGDPMSFSGVPMPLGNAIQKEMTGIDQTIAFQEFNGNPTISIPAPGGEAPVVFQKQTDIIFADQAYFDLLSYKWAAGSAQRIYEPFMVVLSAQRAKIYFPGVDYANIIGRKIVYDDSVVTTVIGVVNGLNENTDFHYQEFISRATIPASRLNENYSWDSWGSISSSSQLFIKLMPKTTSSVIENQLKALVKKYDPNSNKDNKNTTAFHLQPFANLHFDSVYGTFGDHTADLNALYGLMAVALFLLLLGCINFINLTTAQSSQRAKEIGIRKSMGGSVPQLVLQFLSETLFITLVATIL